MKNFILLTIVIGISDLAGTLSAKFWSTNHQWWLLVLTAICFAIAGMLFGLSMRLNTLAVANIAWIAISVLFITVVDYFYFKENITIFQLTGFVLVLVGFVMINLNIGE